MDPTCLLLAALTAAGMAQSGAAWFAVHRFGRRASPARSATPAITVLKPLHGHEPLLEEALASFCAQDYPAFQIVFGLQDEADPALHVLRRLRRRFPQVDMDVVVRSARHGANHKVSNLINMLPKARHDVLVISDSDIHAGPDTLRSLAASLAEPGVGLATTLYTGRTASDTLTGKLGAAYINQTFLPGALLARAIGRQDCLGATMALTRATLERVGGLPALADHLADDAVLGGLVQAQGLAVGLASTVPATTVPETQMPHLFQHELRWARTIQSMAPLGFALSAVQFPLFWAVLLLGASGGAGWAWMTFAVAWAGRAAYAWRINRILRIAQPLSLFLLPLRDVLSMSVILASYGTDRVAWRGQTYRVTRTSPVPGKG